MSANQFSVARANFGINVGKDLTPNMQAIGEFGYIGDMLPPLTADLISLTPYDLRVSAYYGEGGVRLLAAPGRGVNPYFEATAGIARLTPQVSFGSGWEAIVNGAFNLFRSTEPILGLGGGVLLGSGKVVADLGYRYKQVSGGGSIASLLNAGEPLRAHQVRIGIGVRF